ncbi:MAG: hypothetical protein HC824_21475 [Synechococcales cyanobacterium RM1_1_8]|nr:hypothetical protein [Synechococcales cyanobacterium RM1_1_8]
MGNVKPVISETTDLMLGRQGSVAKARTQVLQRVRYRAVWRAGWLVICPVDCHPFRQSVSAVMEGDRDRLLACLRHSTVKRILLSPDLPVGEMRLWAELGREVGRLVYVRRVGRSAAKASRFVRLVDIGGGVFLSFVLSPVMLGIATGIVLTSRGPLFARELCVATNGSLFEALRFRTEGDADSGEGAYFSRLGRLLRRSRLDLLPQFIQVAQGKIRLFVPAEERSRSSNRVSEF